MSRFPQLGRVACVIAVAICPQADAVEPGGGTDLFGQMVPARRASDLDPASVVLQMTPNFVLWDAAEKYSRFLARYRANKPYHSLSLLEELGWKTH
jgi:hypothetical protein